MAAIVKVFKYNLLFSLLVSLFPLYVTIFITPVWVWLLFSLFYAVAYLFLVRTIKHYLKVCVLLFAMLPFLFFDALLLVNYFIQGTGFNEAFYFHFNKQGIIGFQTEILILAIIMCFYYFYLCFLTFKLHQEKVSQAPGIFAGAFIIVLALISPQTLSFGKMYLDAHDSPLAEYFPSSNSYDESLIHQLVQDAQNDFKYKVANKKNLVFIYAESLEANFFDHRIVKGQLNALGELQKSSIVFNTMMQTSYTGWTIAGMVASLCGLPLQMPLDSSSNNFNLSADFMPKTECISDILKNEGYALSFLGGANLNFAGKKAFLQTHSFDTVIGKNVFKTVYPENKYDYNQWGLRDRRLFEYALDDYLELAARPDPFAMFLLTLDTHAPGFPDPACTVRYSAIKDNRMLDAVYCGSQLITKFIEKIRQSPDSSNTVIVIMSDHLAHKNPADYLLKKTQRKLMFMINLPAGENLSIDHVGTHYDIGPTVLSTIGFENCDAFGFGQNMLSCQSEERSDISRDGLLAKVFNKDSGIKDVVAHTKIKSFVRTTWGDYLGGINDDGIVINDVDYTISLGDKRFSYRNPQPFRNTEAGALLFKLAKNTFDIKNIISLKDYLRHPDEFSIEHWLGNTKDLYLYIGHQSGLSFLNFTTDVTESNVLVFINQKQGTATVIPIKDKLNISRDDIGNYFKDGKIELVDKNRSFSLLSCLENFCQSHIETDINKIYVVPWGLSIWQISDKGKVKSLAFIDQCGKLTGFNKTPDLATIVNRAKDSGQESIVLIGHNSVFCKPKEDMIRWIKPFALNKLEHIKFSQPYIGIINLKNNKIKEFVSKDYIQATLEVH